MTLPRLFFEIFLALLANRRLFLVKAYAEFNSTPFFFFEYLAASILPAQNAHLASKLFFDNILTAIFVKGLINRILDQLLLLLIILLHMFILLHILHLDLCSTRLLFLGGLSPFHIIPIGEASGRRECVDPLIVIILLFCYLPTISQTVIIVFVTVVCSGSYVLVQALAGGSS